LSKSNISRVRNTDVVSLTGSTIKGLAAGLGIPETEVARAALVSMDIDMPDLGSLDLETVIKMDPSISVHNRTMLLGLVRQMRRPNMEEEYGERTEEEPESRTQTRGPEHSSTTGGDRARRSSSMKRTITRDPARKAGANTRNADQSKGTPLQDENQDPELEAGPLPHLRVVDEMPDPSTLSPEEIWAARTTEDTSGMKPEGE